jgi:uncharacterized protein (TIGR02145 family)
LLAIFSLTQSILAQTDSISDIEGNTYKTVKIGEQWWMAENLKVGKYANGDSIPKIIVDTVWKNASNGAYCYYSNRTQFQDIYGNLYNWHTVNDARGICPEGWHVATDEEWIEMEKYLGMSQSEADKMTAWRGTDEGTKLKATTFGGTDEVGFAALGTGYRDPEGKYRALGTDNDYWTSTPYDNDGSTEGILHGLLNSKPTVVRNFHVTNYGFCVRCVKDAATQTKKLYTGADIVMYPNPSANYIYIKEADGQDMTIHNLHGQTLYKGAITQSLQPFDIAFLYPGTYLLRIMDKQSVETIKFIKE